MANEYVGQITGLNKIHINGLSTDAKPTNIDPDSTFYELDTKLSWVFSKENINPATGNGWWPL